MKFKQTVIFIWAFAACLTGGCSSSAPSISQNTAEEANAAAKERQYFDKAKGNFSALSPQDQAAYNQLAGSVAAGKSTWQFMGRNNPYANAGGTQGRAQSAAEQAARGSTNSSTH